MTARKLLDFSACHNYKSRPVVTARKPLDFSACHKGCPVVTTRKPLDLSACYKSCPVVIARKHITRLLAVDKALACWSACHSGLWLFELYLFVS